jgi:S-adenosylmethionine synthetase
MNMPYLWTSEYVSPGHPDKVADQISDAILDAYLRADKHAKVAAETMVKGNVIYICGEISTACELQQEQLEKHIRKAVCEIGYDHDALGFNGHTCQIIFNISEQSREINQGVVQDNDVLGAGDQGIMFGYATRETPTHMPPAIYLAKQFINVAYGGRQGYFSDTDHLRPDMKSQVTLRYDEKGIVEIDTVVLSVCHGESLTLNDVRDFFHSHILKTVKESNPEHIQLWFTKNTKYLINPAGAWHVGGPVADCGLTGRKIVVDQYGADAPIGGGAFSGKDSTKVDRSAAYMARHIALKTLHEQEEAEKIIVQLAYAIGTEYPVSYRIMNPDTKQEYGLGSFTLEDLTPKAIQEQLGLCNPIYLHTAKYGHFGNAPYEQDGISLFQWESLD